jgi:VanZ family protein
MEFQYKRLRAALVVLALLMCIISLLAPMNEYPYQMRRFFYVHKWVDEASHLLMFAMLMAFTPLMLRIRARHVVIGLTLFAIGTELLQGLTGRTPSLSDVLMDVFGITIGIVAVLFWRSKAGTKTL